MDERQPDSGKKTGIKRVDLSGSTLLETIVASVIFLLIFSISMGSLVKMSMKKVDCRLFIEADKEYRQVLGECVQKKYDTGHYTKNCEWGELEITVEEYGDYCFLRKVTIATRIQKCPVPAVYIHIIDYE